METSPSFKQALRIVMKRNIVRIALLFILLAVWWGVIGFRGGDRYSVTPRTLAKVTLSRVESPTRLLFSLNDSREKKSVLAEILAIDSNGFSDSLNQQCQAKLAQLLQGQSIWIRSAYLGSAQQTVGKILVARPNTNPEDIGLKLVADGCANYNKKDDQYLSPADRQLYLSAQEGAKNARLGVWAEGS